MLLKLVAIFIGGGLGSACRFTLGMLIAKNVVGHFPWNTFLVNILGCLCIGVFAGYFERRQEHGLLSALLITGFCGGFTTFSTFSNETLQLFKQGMYALAACYACISFIVGISCVALGFFTIKNV